LTVFLDKAGNPHEQPNQTPAAPAIVWIICQTKNIAETKTPRTAHGKIRQRPRHLGLAVGSPWMSAPGQLWSSLRWLLRTRFNSASALQIGQLFVNSRQWARWSSSPLRPRHKARRIPGLAAMASQHYRQCRREYA